MQQAARRTILNRLLDERLSTALTRCMVRLPQFVDTSLEEQCVPATDDREISNKP